MIDRIKCAWLHRRMLTVAEDVARRVLRGDVAPEAAAEAMSLIMWRRHHREVAPEVATRYISSALVEAGHRPI
ncbi:hypothetical protein [Streptomyces harbinensis]|uniref:Uncharacterized protein n=1 Tax=Streptomyces harbinensis TaxID=1176198 RepID=A0A1I6WD08_9ACTN|nr:hypothetical protein [Streptomyces harbinensis]SFT23631.1 hypothetical protein SAMN05444716_11916 [Streptomyces harbinensis]